MPAIEAERTLAKADNSVTQAAPAKINLALHVTGRRADGYHEIETLAVFADIGDVIAIRPADSDSFRVSGRYADDVPADGTNLVVKARDLLRGLAPTSRCPPAAITLEKNLPVASGIGGGSSDAAATLKALARHWQLDLDPGDLATAALGLGADLPMCLAARPLVAAGIGERITPLSRFPALHLVLANPGITLETPAVFGALQSRDNPPMPSLPPELEFDALFVNWLAGTRNDLEAPAMRPEVARTLDAISETGAVLTRMSGSGATCFGIYPDALAAGQAAQAIRDSHPRWFVEPTTTGAGE